MRSFVSKGSARELPRRKKGAAQRLNISRFERLTLESPRLCLALPGDGYLLRRHALEPRVVTLDASHGVVDELGDGALPGLGSAAFEDQGVRRQTVQLAVIYS